MAIMHCTLLTSNRVYFKLKVDQCTTCHGFHNHDSRCQRELCSKCGAKQHDDGQPAGKEVYQLQRALCCKIFPSAHQIESYDNITSGLPLPHRGNEPEYRDGVKICQNPLRALAFGLRVNIIHLPLNRIKAIIEAHDRSVFAASSCSVVASKRERVSLELRMANHFQVYGRRLKVARLCSKALAAGRSVFSLPC